MWQARPKWVVQSKTTLRLRCSWPFMKIALHQGSPGRIGLVPFGRFFASDKGETAAKSPTEVEESKPKKVVLKTLTKKKPPPSHAEKLPDRLWKPEEEFVSTGRTFRIGLRNYTQISGRIIESSFKTLFRPTPLILLGISISSVFLIGAYEASLLLAPDAPPEAISFVLRYGAENLLSSCVWDTKPAVVVVEAMGRDPAEFLRVFTDSQEDAVLQLRIWGCVHKRSMIASFMGISQLLGIVTSSLRAVELYTERVLKGKEPLIKGFDERVIRLCGRGSDTTELAMSRYGQHILPVFEEPESIRYLVEKWSNYGTTPVFWQVNRYFYGHYHSWAKLEIDESYMLKSTTGRLTLVIEADATVSDFALDFSKASDDLLFESASQAFRAIEKKASERIEGPFRVLRTFLGDSRKKSPAGGSTELTLRQRVDLKKEVDVLIDAKAPLLLAILKWCQRTVAKTSSRVLLLDSDPANFSSLKAILTSYGYNVLDQSDLEESIVQEHLSREYFYGVDDWGDYIFGSGKDEKISVYDIPRLIYHNTTSATVNATYALISAGLADPHNCCVLIDSHRGLEEFSELLQSTKNRFEIICSAIIYDDLFRQVRVWTRMGYSSRAIQKELDKRFKDVLKICDEVEAAPKALALKKKVEEQAEKRSWLSKIIFWKS